MNTQKVILLTIIGSVLSACSAPKNTQVSTQCKEPRPQICTMIYQPVCGVNKDGITKDYPSDCSACSDSNVAEYIEGACKKNN